MVLVDYYHMLVYYYVMGQGRLASTHVFMLIEIFIVIIKYTPISDHNFYPSLAAALQYLTYTRPDLSYAVQ